MSDISDADDTSLVETVMELDTVPDVLNRLENHDDIPVVIDWVAVLQWAEKNLKNEYLDAFMRVTKDRVEAKKMQPALRTYLLYVYDLAQRAAEAENEEAGKGKELFDRCFWSVANNIDPGCEGFKGLLASIMEEFRGKHIHDGVQMLDAFFKFSLRATSCETIQELKKYEKDPRNYQKKEPSILERGCRVMHVVDEIPLMKECFGPLGGFDENFFHHEILHLNNTTLLTLLYFMRMKFHKFTAHKQQHIAVEIITIIEETIALKLCEEIAQAKRAASAGGFSEIEAAVAKLNTTIWPQYKKIFTAGMDNAYAHLATVQPHEGPTNFIARTRRAIARVFGPGSVIDSATRFAGITQIIEIVLAGNELLQTRLKREKKEEADH